MNGAKTVSEILNGWLDDLSREPQRHPVVRTGERDPIPWVVRLSVARRDGFRCRRCGRGMPEMEDMELDHLLPWSAGGGDHSSNLRVLCHRCNQDRSNWNDGDHEREARPTTWWCSTCWLDPEIEANIDDHEFIAEYGPGQRRRQAWKSGIDLTVVPFVRENTILAYCAWCWDYGTTDVAFTANQQNELAARVTSREPEPTDEEGDAA